MTLRKTIILLIPALSLNIMVKAQTIIPGGFVSGNWTAQLSPYLIHDNILVDTDSTLTVSEGTIILFSGPFMLEVKGQLLVTGTASDPVIFDRETDTIAWHGIFFNTTDTSITDSSILQHGVISHCYGNPCLALSGSSRLRVSAFTIQYGETFRGAGISCSFSNPLFDSLQVQYNHSLDGAGISVENSAPLIKNCTITGNSADGAGGGMVIFDSSAPVLENCNISGNNSFGSGGGVYINDSFPVFIGCGFSGNNGAEGGGTNYSGGGVSVKLDSNPHFVNCKFDSNSSNGNGGGISSFSPNEIIDCLFSGNTASGPGGGAFLSSWNTVSSNIYNCTFSDNDSPHGSAFAGHNHTAVMKNCILWHAEPENPNSLFYLDAVAAQDVLDASWSDLQNGQAGIELAGNAGYEWGPGNIDRDPGFEAGTFELSWNSPCIEAGTPDTTGLGLPAQDLSGNPRLVNQRVDMGAYEYQQPLAIRDANAKAQNRVKIYPNPTKDWISVDVTGRRWNCGFQLISPDGSLLKSGNLAGGGETAKIDLQGLDPGLYLIVIKNDDFRYSEKIIILK
jgi:parallel beta-helix repeat protein